MNFSSKEKIRQIPITIITGFLGAGKTTLLNHILKSEHGLKPAVLVNDFGKINIDAELVEKIDDDGTISLSNGCICCSIRGDLIGAVTNQYTKPNPPDYIIIECSGVTDPGEVVTTFNSPLLKPFLKIDGIIAVVDAEQILTLTRKYADLARVQIKCATVVILNKADLVIKDYLQTLEGWIRNISPGARILQSDHGRVPLEFILGVGNFDPMAVFKNSQFRKSEGSPKSFVLNQSVALKNTHHDVFSSFSYATEEPIDSAYFRQMIQRLPPTIYRAKGIVYFGDLPDVEHTFHVVGRWAYLTPGAKWGEKKPNTYLVMIGEQGALDEISLNAQMDACLQKNLGYHKASVNSKPVTRQWSAKG